MGRGVSLVLEIRAWACCFDLSELRRKFDEVHPSLSKPGVDAFTLARVRPQAETGRYIRVSLISETGVPSGTPLFFAKVSSASILAIRVKQASLETRRLALGATCNPH